MIYNYKSGKYILGKVARDVKVQEESWTFDALEWIGEALSAIGTSSDMVDKSKVVKTHSHRVALPTDVAFIERIGYGIGNDDETAPPTLENFPLELTYGTPDLHPAIIEEDSSTDSSANSCSETYLLAGDYIKTSFEEDWIAIFYKAIAVDEDGFPKVPDDYSFDQALYWYVVMKMMEGGFEHPNSQIDWRTAEQRWLKYCTQARNKSKMPDPAKMKQFRDSWVRLIPDPSYGTERFNQDDDNTYYDKSVITLEDIKTYGI